MTPRVLVVEDAEPIRTAVGIALTEAGYGVRTRPDGDGFERELAAYRPDLVLLDVMLPGRDGFELLTVARGTATAAPPSTSTSRPRAQRAPRTEERVVVARAQPRPARQSAPTAVRAHHYPFFGTRQTRSSPSIVVVVGEDLGWAGAQDLVEDGGVDVAEVGGCLQVAVGEVCEAWLFAGEAAGNLPAEDEDGVPARTPADRSGAGPARFR